MGSDRGKRGQKEEEEKEEGIFFDSFFSHLSQKFCSPKNYYERA